MLLAIGRGPHPLMRTVFPYGMPISIQCDGSLDSGLDEKEAMLVRFLGPGGEPEVRLLDLAAREQRPQVRQDRQGAMGPWLIDD